MGKTKKDLQEEITELQQQLQEKQILLDHALSVNQLLTEANVDLVWETDQSGKFTYLSSHLKKLWNIDPADVLGKKPLDLVLQSDKEIKVAEVSLIISLRLPISGMLVNVIDDNGKLLYIEVTGNPVFDYAGSFRGYRGTARDISRRALAELALNESTQLSTERSIEIENLYLNLPIGLCVLDTDLRFLRINQRLAEMNGIPVSDHIGKTVDEVVPSLSGTARSIVKKIVETGEPQTGVEFSGFTPAQPGIIRTWSEDWFPVRDVNGKILAVSVMVVESTDQKKAEREKRNQDEQFKIIGDLLPYGLWLTDNEGKAVYTSASFLELLNMTMEESKGFEWTRRLVPGDVEPMMEKWMHSINTGEDWDHVHRIIDRDGIIKSVLTRGRLLHGEKGDTWAGINLDITARTEYEEQIRQSKEALERSQEKLKLALDNGNIGVWEWDVITGEVKWDERMERMFGLVPGSFDGTREGFKSCIHEEDVPYLDLTIEKALKSEISFEAIFRTNPKSGKSNYISSKTLIRRDDDGQPISVYGVCFDVTDMKEGAERSLIALNEALLRSNSDLQQFAYVASHDLQEPLRMVASFTQLLQMQYSDKLDGKANEYINFAVDGAKRLYDLLNGLLAYSRVQTKGASFEEISMETVVQKASENLNLLIEEKAAEITVGKLPRVLADENQMIQLLQNLIDNSIKYCNRTPSVHISARIEDGMHIISVRDNGIGIEPQYYDRIFRIFQRLHLRDEYRGTGIGLAVSKKIVERHGGELWVESVPGEGSTFSFSIPISTDRLSQSQPS